MPSYVTPKKNTEFIFYVSLVSQANAKVFQSNPTLAAGDVKVSTDGGAEANITTLPVVTPASSKRVKVTLSASEMNGDNIQVTFSDAAGGEWNDVSFNIATSLRQIDDLATQASVDTIDDFLDTEIGAILAAVDTEIADIQSRLPAALTGAGNMKTDVLAVNNSTAAAARLALASGNMLPGTVDAAGFSPTTTQFEADDITEATADHFNGRIIVFTSGALQYQATTIQDYALSGGRAHFTVAALTEAPADNGTFLII